VYMTIFLTNTTRNTSENALAAVEQSRSETKIRFDSLQSLTEDVHREFREVKSDAAQALICCTANATQLNKIGSGIEEIGPKMGQLGKSSQEMHMKVDGLGDRIISTQSKIASQLELMARQESSVTKQELLELRNAVMPVITGIHTKLSSLGPGYAASTGAYVSSEHSPRCLRLFNT
jgi:chromosome segregation ATPase